MISRLLAPAKYGYALARKAWGYGVWWFNWHTAKRARDR